LRFNQGIYFSEESGLVGIEPFGVYYKVAVQCFTKKKGKTHDMQYFTP
jgi:hypothetical protein